MRILKIEPGKIPEVIQIGNTLKAMQEVVGGLIQAICPFDDPELVLICNEEGKLLGLRRRDYDFKRNYKGEIEKWMNPEL